METTTTTTTTSTSISDLKRKVREAEQELETAKRVRLDQEHSKFTREVEENVKNFTNLVNKIGVVNYNEDPRELAKDLRELEKISSCCYFHDYDDSPYGADLRGPREAHKINDSIKNKVETFKNQVNERIIDLLLNENI